MRRASSGIPWPSKGAQLALTDLYNVTEQIARSAFTAICLGLDLNVDHLLDEQSPTPNHLLDQQGGLSRLQRNLDQSGSDRRCMEHFAIQPDDAFTDSLLDMHQEVGSSVLRVYQYFREAKSKLPGLRCGWMNIVLHSKTVLDCRGIWCSLYFSRTDVLLTNSGMLPPGFMQTWVS